MVRGDSTGPTNGTRWEKVWELIWTYPRISLITTSAREYVEKRVRSYFLATLLLIQFFLKVVFPNVVADEASTIPVIINSTRNATFTKLQ